MFKNSQRQRSLISGSSVTDFIVDPSDMNTFYVDENLDWEDVKLAKKHSPLSQPMTILPMGTSQTLSFSPFFHPVVMHVKKFSYQQSIEIFLLASTLNTARTFNHSFMEVFGKTTSTFEGHPAFALGNHMIQKFGKITFGGRPRFSTSNDTFQDIFLDNNNREKGGEKLNRTISVLHKWMTFVDSKSTKVAARKIPMEEISGKMEQILKKMKNTSGTQWDFDKFRLSLFTTFASGIGLVKPGVHLHQMIIPLPNMGSLHHLAVPGGENVSPQCLQKAGEELFKNPPKMEFAMEWLSNEMKWACHCRDRVEARLCESRQQSNTQDDFIFGQDIFNLDKHGRPVTKKFGSQTHWELLDTSHVTLSKNMHLKAVHCNSHC